MPSWESQSSIPNTAYTGNCFGKNSILGHSQDRYLFEQEQCCPVALNGRVPSSAMFTAFPNLESPLYLRLETNLDTAFASR